MNDPKKTNDEIVDGAGFGHFHEFFAREVDAAFPAPDALQGDPTRAAFDKMVDELLALHQHISEHELVAKAAKRRKAYLAALVLEQMHDEKFSRHGYTVSKKRSVGVAVKAGMRPMLVKLFEAMKLSDLVTVNTSSIGSRVREWIGEERNVEEVPAEVRECLDINTKVVTLAIRKS
jgi:hypothetical protein